MKGPGGTKRRSFRVAQCAEPQGLWGTGPVVRVQGQGLRLSAAFCTSTEAEQPATEIRLASERRHWQTPALGSGWRCVVLALSDHALHHTALCAAPGPVLSVIATQFDDAPRPTRRVRAPDAWFRAHGRRPSAGGCCDVGSATHARCQPTHGVVQPPISTRRLSRRAAVADRLPLLSGRERVEYPLRRGVWLAKTR